MIACAWSGRFFALLLAVASLAGCASRLARPGQVLLEGHEVVLPSSAVRDRSLFLLSARVNGEGPFAFYLDTGLATSAVSPDVARLRSGDADAAYAALTLKDGAGRPVPVQGTARLASVRIGGLELRDLDVMVLDMEGLSRTLGTPVDGVLGYPCFADGLLTIDYPAAEVRFGDGTLGPVDGSTVFPLTQRGVPAIDLSMEGEALPVRLDSGTERGVILGDLPSSVRFHADPVPAPDLLGPAGRISGHRLGRIRGSIRLGPCLLEDPVVRLKSGERGVVGAAVLRNFRVVLDLAHGRFALEGGPHRLKFAPIHGTGVDLMFEVDAFVARGVIPGGPAESAGLREGDRILSVDGVAAGREMIEKLRTRVHEPGEVLRLQVQRGDRTISLDLAVQTVVP